MNSCEKCVFLEESDKSCKLNKLDIVKEKYQYFLDQNGICNFDGICYGSRSEVWAKKYDIDLKEAFLLETKINPAIFFPISEWQQIKDLEKNFKENIDVAPYINLINYSDIREFDILGRFKNDNRVNITKPTSDILNPYLIMYQNIKLSVKYRYRHMLIIDDVTKAPSKDLYEKIQQKINDEFEPIVAVLGDGYIFILKNLFCHLVANQKSVFEFVAENLDSKEIFKESDLYA